ncbi:transport system permease [Niallia circulans]|nr:iron ABC transporter permease [Niallia circulans]MDR4315959.1 iron ABC transporter permease [Niallia circulans]MED3841227.1 iron ABC transporter permease [Niallia circulans]MED4244779.1 iron ABC transporter permease [Niallia circulans]MED4249738.1 iron ABC transporter permease [Niallia circulans]SPU12651.1 transport system permease [Niallia circulans]
MDNERKRTYVSIYVLIALCLIIMIISLSKGEYILSFQDIGRSIFRYHPDANTDLVIFEFRLPRIILAIFVGFGLGIAGSILQSITKNGLADPGILGINSGAGAAIVAYMFFFQGVLNLNLNKDSLWIVLSMQLIGLVGGFIAAFVIFLLAKDRERLNSQKLILTGIAINSGFGSLAMYMSLKMKAQDFEMAAVWLTGSIYNANWLFILAMLPWFLLIIPFIIRKAYSLDLFQLQETVMIGLGVKVEKEKWLLLLCAVGMIGACVSVSGSIGFIGLMSPHMARLLVGLKHRNSMIVCGLIGSLFMLIADFIGRTIVAPAEISAGIILSIIGAPYFVYLLVKAKV